MLCFKSRSWSTLVNVVMLINTQHVTLKSPKMDNDDDKPSNYRLMIFFAIKPFFLILANL